MMKKEDLGGVIPAIVTPFDEKGDLDRRGLKALTRFLLQNHVHGIMTTGGNGEFPHLSREEKRAVTEAVVQEVKGRVPVIAGTAACSTREAQQLSTDAEAVGADALIMTPPFYYKLPEESLFKYFRQLADRLHLPLIVYNNPLYTGHNLSPELMAGLADLEGIIGLKQSNPDFGQIVEIIRVCGEKISVCTGIDSQFYPALCAGAKGIFSTAACVVPGEMVRIFDLTQKGEYDAAFEVHMKIQELNAMLEYDPGYVSPCKEALSLMGLPGGPVRDPLPPLSASERRLLKSTLRRLNLI